MLGGAVRLHDDNMGRRSWLSGKYYLPDPFRICARQHVNY